MKVTPSQIKVLTPLCPTSAHIANVHDSWPKSLVHRFKCISTHDLELSLSRLHDRYRNANSHPQTLSNIAHAIRELLNPGPPTDRTRQEFFSIVCGYHPVFKNAMKRALKTVQPPASLNKRVLLSWRNVLPSIGSHVVAFRYNELEVQWDNVQREGSLFFVNNVNLQLIHRSGSHRPVGSRDMSLTNLAGIT